MALSILSFPSQKINKRHKVANRLVFMGRGLAVDSNLWSQLIRSCRRTLRILKSTVGRTTCCSMTLSALLVAPLSTTSASQATQIRSCTTSFTLTSTRSRKGCRQFTRTKRRGTSGTLSNKVFTTSKFPTLVAASTAGNSRAVLTTTCCTQV